MFNFKARILLKERDKFAGCVFWREHLESGLWTPCNKVNFLWPVSILSTQILIPFASKSIRNNKFHYMKESPHCPCIPGVSREMRQLFGFNSLKNLAFHIAAESVLSSLVQTAEGEKSRQGKSTSCFVLRYSPLWGDWQDRNILTLLSCRVEPLNCNSVFLRYKIWPLCSRKRFCDLIKTLMLCGLERMGQGNIIFVKANMGIIWRVSSVLFKLNLSLFL